MGTADSETGAQEKANTGPRELDLDGVRVLVADDQPDVLEALRLLLKPHGGQVRAVSSPAAVVSALGESPHAYDLLLMDLNYARDTTSGDEGLELVARVKALDPYLPVVVMTAWSTVPLAVAIMREGVGDFVQKPWDNARLLEIVRAQVAAGRRRRRAQRLEADARDVQSRLLGTPAPRVPGYEVAVAWRLAEGLGGDCYHVAALPEGRLAVAIADVCGKGTPAALLMASVKASLEELVAADLAPRALCARLARTLAPRLGPDRFVSLVYAVLDPARGTLAYANAGHPAPVLSRPDGTVRRLKRGGPVLGVVAEADYEEGLLALHRGDRLVLVTDGITEATSRAEAELGDEGLLAGLRDTRAAAAADTAPRVLELARHFAEDGLADDATVVVVDVLV
ncbi:MAG: response regulator receiver protein [Acidobacteria bacterium]|nr:MAG: response regulator receiver protein [Acidobacteriota bacterium]